MTITSFFELLLTFSGLAVLSCWIAYQSTVVQKIKTFLYMGSDQQYPKWKYWFKPIGFLIEELRELLNCPFCLSYHMGWLTAYLMFDIGLMQSIILGGVTIIFVELYRKISL